jgi:hypothetical protein
MTDLTESGPLGNQQKEQTRAREGKTRERQRDEAFRWLMGDRKGRLLMWELLGKTGVFKGGLIETTTMLFNEGARNVGLKYLADIQRLAPAQFITMQAEANAKPEKIEGAKDGGRDDDE